MSSTGRYERRDDIEIQLATISGCTMSEDNQVVDDRIIEIVSVKATLLDLRFIEPRVD